MKEELERFRARGIGRPGREHLLEFALQHRHFPFLGLPAGDQPKRVGQPGAGFLPTFMNSALGQFSSRFQIDGIVQQRQRL